jgi:hypothetical protein
MASLRDFFFAAWAGVGCEAGVAAAVDGAWD